jgi:hypothetical protein
MLFVFGMDMFWSDIVFTIYSVMISAGLGLMCGSVSLLSSLAFVHLIYDAGKHD